MLLRLLPLIAYATLATHHVAAQWTFVDLGPADINNTICNGVHGNQQVGTRGYFFQERALLWSGSLASLVELTPADHPSQFDKSAAYSVFGGVQGGYVGSTLTSDKVAVLWRGSASSMEIIQPNSRSVSVVNAVGARYQGGNAAFSSLDQPRACIWQGTSASWLDIHPSGASRSNVTSVHGEFQGGTAMFGNNTHAGIWRGTSQSWVDLHPGHAVSSAVWCIDDGVQGGIAMIANSQHAFMWRGSPSAWIDLHPSIASYSGVGAVCSGMQFGFIAINNVNRAVMWRGSASSWEDLTSFMGPGWSGSGVRAAYCDGNYIYAVGYAGIANSNFSRAVMWYRPLTFCPADFNRDSVHDFFDYLDFVSDFAASLPRADFNSDSIIDFNDYLNFVAAFASGC